MSALTVSRQCNVRRAIVVWVPRQCVIYALFDPQTPEHIRYVGHAFDTRQRLQQHIRDGAAPAMRNTRKGRWIAALLAEHVLPELLILERQVPPAQAKMREGYWINRLLLGGHDLTNAPGSSGRPAILSAHHVNSGAKLRSFANGAAKVSSRPLTRPSTLRSGLPPRV